MAKFKKPMVSQHDEPKAEPVEVAVPVEVPEVVEPAAEPVEIVAPIEVPEPEAPIVQRKFKALAYIGTFVPGDKCEFSPEDEARLLALGSIEPV
jgi:hypothetical protein